MDNVKYNHYEVLGLPQVATHQEIEEACLRLAKKYHPDTNPGDPLAARNFAQIEVAYETLGNPAKRQHYDNCMRAPADTPKASVVATDDGSTATESDKKNGFLAFIAGGFAGLIVGLVLILVGSLLSATLIGAILGIPIIGAGLFLMLSGPIKGVLNNRNAIKGPCPYCGTTVQGQREDAGLTCKACKKRLVQRDNRFYRVD